MYCMMNTHEYTLWGLHEQDNDTVWIECLIILIFYLCHCQFNYLSIVCFNRVFGCINRIHNMR